MNRAHARVANLGRDGLHKLTTRLARERGTVVVEDLNVSGMKVGLPIVCLPKHTER